ncbi:MAG: DUF3579 domain-containing protein [Gammaproteobacteria bacterium]|nr:DUF3579 domain-containing protein [Gammaproteobacteria bacterium]
MTKEKPDQYILGVTQSGRKFRPSDWVDRVASLFANFDAARRLRYNPLVTPVVIEGLYCLFVAGILAVQNPEAYSYIMEFASSNALQIKEINQVEVQDLAANLPHVA